MLVKRPPDLNASFLTIDRGKIPSSSAMTSNPDTTKSFEQLFWKTHLTFSFSMSLMMICNGLNNFDRGPPRDHSCEVWSKSNKRFQRCCLKKLLTDVRTTDIEGSQKLTEHFVLRWAKIQIKKKAGRYSISSQRLRHALLL